MGILDDKEIYDAVITETQELLYKLDLEIMLYEKDMHNLEHVKKLFRFIHTIKGNAGMLNNQILIDLSHKFEDVLGLIRDEKRKIHPIMFPVFFRAIDIIKELFKKIKGKEEIKEDISEILSQLDYFILNEKIEESKTLDIKEQTTLSVIDSVKKEFIEVEDIRVNINRVDTLINLLGELHLNNMIYNRLFYDLRNKQLARIVSARISSLEEFLDNFEDKIIKFNRLLDTFRNDLLNIRMVKLSSLFNRFPKVVRELSEKLNKKIEIYFSGDELEIDKRVLEEATEPLLHIIRNSIDHGIEKSSERLEKKKSEIGVITVDAFLQSGKIIIEIADDGQGLDKDKIIQTILKNKMATQDEIANMQETEIINYIFLPGFSTKEEVSDISGRGVGMDIVSEKVKNLKGEIKISSEKDKGTTIKIALPMTLSIIECFSVEINQVEYLFFKSDISFLLKLEKEEIKKIDNDLIYEYENRVISLYSLKKVLGIKEEKDTQQSFPTIVINHNDTYYGFIVDKLNGIKNIVLKNTGSFIKKLRLFEGATIQEEGSVALVFSKSGIMDNLKKLLREKNGKN